MYQLLDDFPFVRQYWAHILIGGLTYIFARLYLQSRYQSESSYGTMFQESEDSDELKDNCKYENLDDENYFPTLPEDLEHVPLSYERISEKDIAARSEEFYNFMNLRRTVRHFSTDDVPIDVIRNIIRTAGTSPSGAHTEPWTYVIVSNLEIKQKIREIIELEEEVNYKQRMGKKWTTDLKPLKTNWIKEYLTEAPYLILLFKQMYSYRNGLKRVHHYNEMSVCLSAGMLLTAIHYAGLVSLTSTPLNCGPALRKLLNRPANEKLMLLLPVGYPAENCLVPDLKRKKLEEYTIEV